MKMLVTGGSGFIGTRLVCELLARGHEVRILDKIASERYPDLCQVGDVRDASALAVATRQVDAVFHLAAEHRDDVSPISLYYDVNVAGSRNVADACAANGVSRIVFASSVAVYGLDAGEPTEDSPVEPFNDYGRSKLQAEGVFRQWAEAGEGRSVLVVRPATIFGEGNRGNVYNLVRQIASCGFVMIGDGNNRKSMGFVENIAAFLGYINEAPQVGVQTCNYADKPDLSMNELVALVRKCTGRSGESRLRIPYWIGMAGGVVLDGVSALTGRKLPISAIRIRKFCSTTTVGVQSLRQSGFTPPYSLGQAMEMFLNSEFADRGGRQH